MVYKCVASPKCRKVIMSGNDIESLVCRILILGGIVGDQMAELREEKQKFVKVLKDIELYPAVANMLIDINLSVRQNAPPEM